MTAIWQTVLIADVLKERVTYGIVQPGSHDLSGVPIVRAGDIGRGLIKAENPKRVSESLESKYSRTRLVGGEVLLSLVGTVGESAVVPLGLAGWNVARAVGVLRPDRVSADWLHICLQSEYVQQQLREKLNTTVQATLNLQDLAKVAIPVPSQDEQRAIAEVLGAIDDKIAANQAISLTTDALVAALFSRVCISSATSPLSCIASVNVATAKPSPGGKLRYLDIASVGQGRYESPELMDWIDAPSRARRSVQRGDTVWSTVRPNRRSHALVLESDPVLVASTGLAVLSPHPGRVACLFESTRRPEFEAYLVSVAEGSAYPAVNASRFEHAPIPDLESDVWDAFESLAMPLRERAHAAAMESDRLAATRDALLPLLMSGKVRVKDAEKIVEEAL